MRQLSTRLQMPATFGPSIFPSVSTYERQSTVAISFKTDRDAVAPLLPPWFTPSDEPVVSFTHQQLEGIDYLQGRGYNLVNVAVTARFDGKRGTLERPCPIVIWESDTMPIIAGRELAGNPKIYGQVSDLRRQEDSASFECREYGTLLVAGAVNGLRPLTEGRLERVNQTNQDSSLFSWKLIPGCDGPDADYPTLIHGSTHFVEAWSGTGTLEICSPTIQDAPISSHIVAALRALPQLEQRRAFVGVGTAQLYRDRTERLS
jgi:acetoacetate decarboxylase